MAAFCHCNQLVVSSTNGYTNQLALARPAMNNFGVTMSPVPACDTPVGMDVGKRLVAIGLNIALVSGDNNVNLMNYCEKLRDHFDNTKELLKTFASFSLGLVNV